MATPRHRNNGLRKICGCARRTWSTCRHAWHFSWKPRGADTQVRFSLDTYLGRHVDSRSEAEAIADQVRHAIRKGAFDRGGPMPETMTLRQLCTLYMERCFRVNHPDTAKDVESVLRLIYRLVLPRGHGREQPLGDWPASAITLDTLERVKEQKAAAPGSANLCLGRLRAIFNWAVLKGYLEKTPFKVNGVTALTLFPMRPRHRRLEDGEEPRLLAACKTHLRALVEAALETCCRKGELLSLQWWQVRWEQNGSFCPPSRRSPTAIGSSRSRNGSGPFLRCAGWT